MVKRTSDFVEAFKCKRCGKVISNDPELPEVYNEYTVDGDLRPESQEIEEPGRFEAHTSILEHSRDEHGGDFIGMYESVNYTYDEVEALVSSGKSEEVVA